MEHNIDCTSHIESYHANNSQEIKRFHSDFTEMNHLNNQSPEYDGGGQWVYCDHQVNPKGYIKASSLKWVSEERRVCEIIEFIPDNHNCGQLLVNQLSACSSHIFWKKKVGTIVATLRTRMSTRASSLCTDHWAIVTHAQADHEWHAHRPHPCTARYNTHCCGNVCRWHHHLCWRAWRHDTCKRKPSSVTWMHHQYPSTGTKPHCCWVARADPFIHICDYPSHMMDVWVCCVDAEQLLKTTPPNHHSTHIKRQTSKRLCLSDSHLSTRIATWYAIPVLAKFELIQFRFFCCFDCFFHRFFVLVFLRPCLCDQNEWPWWRSSGRPWRTVWTGCSWLNAKVATDSDTPSESKKEEEWLWFCQKCPNREAELEGSHRIHDRKQGNSSCVL